MSAILKKYGTNLLMVLMLVLSNAAISSADDVWVCGTPAPTSDIQLLTPTSQIIIEDADTIWNTSIVYSSDLINTTSNVTPRVLSEYANTIYKSNLILSTDLVNVTLSVTPRIMAEYANTIYRNDLNEIPTELANLIEEAPPKRLIIEYANSNYYKRLIFPKELINDTTPPIISNITVTNITENSATIKWDTDEFADSLVKYGTSSGAYTKQEYDELFVKKHAVSLYNLSPGTKYYFVVRSVDLSGNSAESSEYCFTTSGAQEKWSFAIITDLHIGYGIPDFGTDGWDDTLTGNPALDNYYLTKRLEAVVDWINDHIDDYNIKFVAVLGDITDTAERSEFIKAKEILDKLGVPYFPIIGNHDMRPYTQCQGNPPSDRTAYNYYGQGEISRTYFEEIFNTTFLDKQFKRLRTNWEKQWENDATNYYQNFAFEYQNITFIFLDFNPGDHAPYPKGGIMPWAILHNETYNWFREQLEKNRGEKVIVFSHYAFGWPYPFIFKNHLDAIKSLIKSYDCEVYNFAGHDHKNDVGSWAGGKIIRTEAVLEESSKVIRIVQIQGNEITYDILKPEEGELKPAINPYITFNPKNIGVGTEVKFEAGAKPWLFGISYEWDLNGDEEIDSTDDDPSYTYETPGNYIVSLTITDNGNKEMVWQRIKVSSTAPEPRKIDIEKGLHPVLAYEGTDVSEVAQNTPELVTIMKSSSELKPVADLLVHFENATEDIDLTNLTADTNLTTRKSVIYMPEWPSVIEESKILYIPSSGKGAVYICKNATNLEEVSLENADLVINVGETIEGMTVAITLYNDTEYYTVFNITGTGGGEAPSQHPYASFTYSPECPVINEKIIFNASSSYDPDGKITAYEWDFGDGNVTNTTEEKINHSYSEAGIYEVTLTVKDDEGAMNSTTKVITVYSRAIFDCGEPKNPYPSIMGVHRGTIKPYHTVIATKLYTYACEGTGGHTEYARIWNETWEATATWEGYAGDWHNITFDKTVVLLAGETYFYEIRTGSYPQIHHTDALLTANGWINCTEFTDANGRVYYDWIPAIKLF